MLRNLAILTLLTLALVQAEVEAKDSYLVKERKIDNVPEALSILRRFIPLKENFDDKCQRYAVLLKRMAIEPIDQFSVAELGLIKSSFVNNKFKEIDVETLRQLYMDAISKSLNSHLDLSLVELVDCLVRKFRSHDAKARAFLNTPELQETLEQYKSIMALPVSFSQDPTARHPTLALNQLQPAIVRLMLDLYNNDEARLRSHFAPEVPLVSRPVAPAPAQPRPVAAEAQATVYQPAQGYETGSERENLPTTPVLSQEQNSLSQEEQDYLDRVNESLKQLYGNLPVQSSLARRCEAYANVMESNPEQVGEGLVRAIVEKTSEKLSSTPEPTKFLPAKETRESFLIALDSFRPEQRDSVWLDIIDCVSEWENEDADVKAYLSNPELLKVVDEMLKSLESNAAQGAEGE